VTESTSGDSAAEADALDVAISKMEKIAKAVKAFDAPEIQAKVYATLAATAFATSVDAFMEVPEVSDPPTYDGVTPVELDEPQPEGSESNGRPPAKGAKKAAKKAGKKPTYSATKGIVFAPQGKTSWRDFAAEKSPKNNFEKALVAVHYLSETLERTVVTGDVIAAFDFVGWKNPTDPVNNLQQAGSKGWLDTSNMNDIKTVWSGENYVKHDLPKAK